MAVIKANQRLQAAGLSSRLSIKLFIKAGEQALVEKKKGLAE